MVCDRERWRNRHGFKAVRGDVDEERRRKKWNGRWWGEGPETSRNWRGGGGEMKDGVVH